MSTLLFILGVAAVGTVILGVAFVAVIVAVAGVKAVAKTIRGDG